MSAIAAAPDISDDLPAQQRAVHQPETSEESSASIVPVKTTSTEGIRHIVPQEQSEDPATLAASEELRHTSLSEKSTANPSIGTVTDQDAVEAAAQEEDKEMKEIDKSSTPDQIPSDEQDEEMRERLSSPKKKRGRDNDEENKELREDELEKTASDGSAPNASRSTRSEPEKKRHRDGSEDRPVEAAVLLQSNKVCRKYYALLCTGY